MSSQEETIRALTAENEQLRSRVKELEGKLPGSRGYLFVSGGELNDDSIASVERYDPNLSFWTPVTSMHEARSNHFFIRCGNYLYAIGGKATGLSIDGQITCLNSVERYNVVSNKWDRVAPMNKERFDFAAVVMNNEIYVFGGKVLLEYNHVTKTRATSRAEKYDPTTNTWLELPKMNQARSSPSVIIVNKMPYVIGGDNFDGTKVLDSIERLDVRNQRWIEETYKVSHENVMHPTTALTSKQKIVTIGGQLNKTPETWRDILVAVPNAPAKQITSWTHFHDALVFFVQRQCRAYNEGTKAWYSLPKTYHKRQNACVASFTDNNKNDEVSTAAQKGTGLAANPNIPYYGNGLIQCFYSIEQIRDYFLANRFEDDTTPLSKPLAKVFRALFEGSDQTPVELFSVQGPNTKTFFKEFVRQAEREQEDYYKKKSLSNLSPFKRLFAGEIQSNITCSHCSNVASEKMTRFPYILKIDANIESCLENYFKEQPMPRRVECRSVLCDGVKQEAVRRRIMMRCPRVLVMLITNSKSVPVSIPPTVSFQYEYSLFAVAIKLPEPLRLVSYCKRENDWLLFDNNTVTSVDRPAETSTSNSWLFYLQSN
jgi:hypothetical protein